MERAGFPVLRCNRKGRASVARQRGEHTMITYHTTGAALGERFDVECLVLNKLLVL